MPLCHHLPLSCALALSALCAHAGEPWSNHYTVPQPTTAEQSTTTIWSAAPPLPTPRTPQPAQAGPQPQASQSGQAVEQLCRPGNRVEAKSAGQWYEAHILSADAHYQTCDVTYTGFGKHYDETVSLSRLRPYTGNVTPPPKPSPKSGGGNYGAPATKIPTCSSIPRSDGMGNTSYCY